MANSTSSGNGTRQELLRRLTTLAGNALPSFHDTTNATFDALQADVPAVDGANATRVNLSLAFDTLVKSIASNLPHQIGGAMAIGSPKEALEETLNQASQALTLATPGSPVVARMVATLKSKPLDVDVRRGPTGLSTSLPADLSAIKDAALRIAGGVPRGTTPDVLSVPRAPRQKPGIVGPRVFTASANPFTTTVVVGGGSGTGYSPDIVKGTGVTITATSDATRFQITAFAPGAASPSSLPFEVVWTDGQGTQGSPQLVVVDWSAWVDAQQPALVLDGAGPTLNLGATMQVYEVAFKTRNLPAGFSVTVQGVDTPIVWTSDSRGLKAWIDLHFLFANNQTSFSVQILDPRTNAPACACSVPTQTTESGVGPALSLEGSGGAPTLSRHAGDLVVLGGTGIDPDAVVNLIPS